MAESTQAQLLRITGSLARIEARLADRVPPADVRKHIAEVTATADQVETLVETLPLQGQQLDAIATTLDAQMTDDELRKELRNALSYIRQFTSVMQGTRTDIVELRGDFRRLSALLEQTLHVRIEDEERGIAWNGEDRRRNSIADRRGRG